MWVSALSYFLFAKLDSVRREITDLVSVQLIYLKMRFTVFSPCCTELCDLSASQLCYDWHQFRQSTPTWVSGVAQKRYKRLFRLLSGTRQAGRLFAVVDPTCKHPSFFPALCIFLSYLVLFIFLNTIHPPSFLVLKLTAFLVELV